VAVAALAIAASLWLASVAASPESRPPVSPEVDAVAVTVSDLGRSVRFFTDVLGFSAGPSAEAEGRDVELLTGVFGARVRRVRLTLGSEAIELTEFAAPRGRPFPSDTRGNDQWFQHIAIITSDMKAAYARLRERGVASASTGPQRLPDSNPNAGGIEAFYFHDPDGHFLEVLQFPPGKGDPRWHARDRLFLGIDHTAIVSTDTERSLRFYRDGVGLAVAGGAENYGVEQEHLNNVFGVRLRITTLRGTRGPGVELLEYLAPRTGRPTPRDLMANDLAHWETVILDRSPERWLHATSGGWLVSPSVVTAPPAYGFAHGLLVRDPDAHGVRLIDR
jgi:catechol 2,3-dioxygenase-like lactoylglutathione lyase family enzyme